MSVVHPDSSLSFLNDLVADGRSTFTFAEAVSKLGRSRSATANFLGRMVRKGLLDCVRRGHYAIRPLGVLGTSAASEDIALAVGAAFSDRAHRIGYRSALDEHSLVTQPVRMIHVALTGRTRTKRISNRPLRVVIESPGAISVGVVSQGGAQRSDLERSLLDGGARPDLVSPACLAEALVAAAGRVDVARLMEHARHLAWATAVRRIGSLSDALEISGLAGRLEPLGPLTGDIALEPRSEAPTEWRDERWRVRWSQTREELRSVARQ